MHFPFFNFQSSLSNRRSRGFAYIALLTTIIIIGISMGAAGKYWSSVIARDKEEELLFRGDQYRQAIELYYLAIPGKPQYPPSIDDLLSDSRTTGKRYLRRKFKDPVTGEDFELLRAVQTRQIVGVVSKSRREPMKKGNFEESYKELTNKSRYNEWLFIARAAPGQDPLVLALPESVRDGDAGHTGDAEEPGSGGSTATVLQPVDSSLPGVNQPPPTRRRLIPGKPANPVTQQ